MNCTDARNKKSTNWIDRNIFTGIRAGNCVSCVAYLRKEDIHAFNLPGDECLKVPYRLDFVRWMIQMNYK